MNFPGTGSPEPDSRQRLFLAIPLPLRVKESLAKLQPAPDSNCRLAEIEQLHITLYFLGSVAASMVRRLCNELQIPPLAPFPIELAGTGAFRRQRNNAVYWVGINPSPELVALHDGLGRSLQGLGVKVEIGRYRPHVTLARFRRPDPDQIEALCSQHELFSSGFVVDCFCLFRSELRATGAVHHCLAEYRLGLTQTG